MARRRTRAPWVRLRRPGVPGAWPYGDRRGRRSRCCRSRAGSRAGLLRRLAADERSHGDDQDGRRLRRHAPPSRLDPCQRRRRSRRGRIGGHDRAFGRSRGRRAVRSPRRQAGRRSEGVRQPAHPAAATCGPGRRPAASGAAHGGRLAAGAATDSGRRGSARAAWVADARRRASAGDVGTPGSTGRRARALGGECERVEGGTLLGPGRRHAPADR
jgi:hypothetical protein